MITSTFDTGIPDQSSIIVTDYGYCTFKRHHENGDVDLYMGHGRTFTVAGSTRWRYARYQK